MPHMQTLGEAATHNSRFMSEVQSIMHSGHTEIAVMKERAHTDGMIEQKERSIQEAREQRELEEMKRKRSRLG